MKKSFKLVIGFSFFIVMTSLIIINTDETEIVSFKKRMYNTILTEIGQNHELIKIPKNFIMEVVPSCYISINQLFSKKNECIDSLSIDSTFGYAIIRNQYKVIAVASKTSLSYSFLTNELISPHVKRFAMIEKAMQYSDNPFFVYFLKDERYWQDVIGFFSDGNVSFIDLDLNKYSNSEAIIKHRYGCIDKYLEIKAEAKLKEELKAKIVNIEQAKFAIRNDYMCLQNYFPQDTMDVFKLFIVEMNSIINLTEDQNILIKQKVLNKIRNYRLNTYTGCGIPFYGEDISYEVQSVLTTDQYNKYIAQRALNSWLAAQASNKVYYYAKKEKGIQDSQIKAYFIQAVFNE